MNDQIPLGEWIDNQDEYTWKSAPYAVSKYGPQYGDTHTQKTWRYLNSTEVPCVSQKHTVKAHTGEDTTRYYITDLCLDNSYATLEEAQQEALRRTVERLLAIKERTQNKINYILGGSAMTPHTIADLCNTAIIIVFLIAVAFINRKG